MGSYAYDAEFLQEHGIQYIELLSKDQLSKVMVIPQWQGRVMTTTAAGNEGDSYGWINYKFIQEGRVSSKFNPVGGEERFWLGPEGGPFSLYFKEGEEQVYDNWIVPSALDTEPFNIVSKDAKSVHFIKDVSLPNASGTHFQMKIDRSISLLDREEVNADFGITIPADLKFVAYKSNNQITNTGQEAWTRAGGLVSVWMLGCFNPTPTTTVFIPYKKDAEGDVVHDEYFGKVPSDRLITDSGIIYFKIDGRYRSKIGLPSSRATNLCGSYDTSKGVVTILWCSLPQQPSTYVNSQWGDQEDSFNGDVINSYNDGPVEDGSIMGPFFEIETSSPAAELLPHQSLSHIQKVIHLQGNKEQLAPIVQSLFGVNLDTVSSKFKED